MPVLAAWDGREFGKGMKEYEAAQESEVKRS